MLHCAVFIGRLLSILNTAVFCLGTGQPNHLSLWVGTSSGHVFIYQLTVPDGERRREEDVTCFLGKYQTSASVLRLCVQSVNQW